MSRDKKPWSQFEDDSLKSLITAQKTIRWCEVAKLMKQNFGITNRSGKQCRDRWNNHLDPNTRKRDWTYQEDETIFTFQHYHGNKWSELANLLSGRSDNTIKNRFYATIRRKIRKYNKIYDNKIAKQLNEVINDAQLMKILRNIPEKPKTNTNFQLRRSSRLSAKKKTKNSDIETQEFYMKTEIVQKENKGDDDKEKIVNFDNKIDKKPFKDYEYENYTTGVMSPYDVLDLTDENMNGSSGFFQKNDESFSDLPNIGYRGRSFDVGNCMGQEGLELSERIVLKCDYDENCLKKIVTNTAFQC